MVGTITKDSTRLGLINAFALVNSKFFLERERERERDAPTIITRANIIQTHFSYKFSLVLYPQIQCFLAILDCGFIARLGARTNKLESSKYIRPVMLWRFASIYLQLLTIKYECLWNKKGKN